MAIVVNSGHTTLADGSSVTNHVINVPTHSEGDAIYIAIVCDGSQSFTFPAGFSKLITDTVTSSTATLAMARKVAGGSEGSTYTVVTSGSERAVAIAWSQSGDNGVDGTTPTPNTGDGTTATAPSMSTTVANALVLRVVGTDNLSSTHSTLSGYTKIAEVEQTSAGTISVQWIVQSSAGSTGTAAVTIATEQWAAATVAIAPTASPHDLTANGITTGSPTLGTPALGQVHVLAATGVTTGSPTLGTPVLTELGGLVANGITTGSPTLGTPALGQVHALTATGITTGSPSLESPAWLNVLTANGITAGVPTLGSPALADFFAINIPSIPVGTAVTCLLADPFRRIVGQAHPHIGPVSWRINDFGVVKLTFSRNDPMATKDTLRAGCWVYLMFGNGLPDWAGFIMDAPEPVWTYHDVTFTVYSAEALLKRYQTDKGRYFNNATAGYIFRSVIGDANAAWGMDVAIGNVAETGTTHSPSYHFKDLFWIVQNSICNNLENYDFYIEPSLVNGKIDLTAHLYEKRGSSKPDVALIQGHNMIDEKVLQPGPLVNHYQLAGADVSGDASSGWGDGRLADTTTGVDAESIALHGRWMGSEVFNAVRSQGELSNLALWLIQRTKRPRMMICCAAKDLAPARYADYDVGTAVRGVVPVATFDPFDDMIRVVGREFDLKSGVCSLALEAV